jgi:hypothetical protein
MKPFVTFAVVISGIVALGSFFFAIAQTPAAGTLTVTVADAANAMIPGVTVTATGAGATVRGVTNEKGVVALRVPDGTYLVTAVLRGFLETSAEITIKNSENFLMNLTLRVGPQTTFLPPATPFQREQNVDITGDTVTMQGPLVLYRGNVRMRTEGVEIRADEIDFNTVTRTASVRGTVTVRVLTVGPRFTPLSN